MRDTIHDCYYNVFNEKPQESTISKILFYLPESVLIIAEQWGPNDTEFREKVHEWLQNNKELSKQND